MNTSKIKTILQSKQSPKNNKRYTLLEMEDGTKGTISHDNENQYKVGQELKYDTKPTKDDPSKFWISEAKEKKFPQKNYKAEFAMKALECAVSCANTAYKSGSESKLSVNIVELSDTFFDRLQKKSLSANQNG